MKPGVFTQLYIHIVIAPKYREKLLVKEIKSEVFSYMSGIITKRGSKSIIINGMADHAHILLGMNPDDKISDLVGCVKKESSIFINGKNYFRGKFHWQDGYGAFSYSKSQLDAVYNYIARQEVHHRKKTFRDEYVELLRKFSIEFNDNYLFEFFNDVEVDSEAEKNLTAVSSE
jgi:putative transposase